MTITNFQVHRKCNLCGTRMLGIMIQSGPNPPRKICYQCEEDTGLNHMGESKSGKT